MPGAPLRLRAVSGPGAGALLLLEGAPATLGRETDNALVIPDPKVSRHHARVDRYEGLCVLTDLGSRNGTRVNGLPVLRAGLAPGDFLYLGDTVLRVEAGP